MTTSPDPRDIITEDAFSVAPELIGRPLARPWRRAAAMLVDLFFVALLANTAAVFFGVTAAVLLFRVSFRSTRGGFVRRSVRWVLRAGAAFTLFVTVVAAWGAAMDEDDAPSIDDWPDEYHGVEVRRQMAAELGAAGVEVTGLTDAVPAAEHDAASGQGVGLDSAVLAYAAERRELARRIESLQERSDELEEELEAARRPRGVLSFLRETADDLGLGLGWSGIYFVAFLVLWSGRTPGKRLLGIRVLRLDGKPIGWWAALERFGGYAASVVTGLLGFAQIYWDRNRQALHDKVAETVVACE